MYTCKDINQLLDDYLDERLPADLKKDMDHHLNLCENCVKYINTYKKTIELTRGQKKDSIPEELASKLRDLLPEKK